jgi:hypothetical protein
MQLDNGSYQRDTNARAWQRTISQIATRVSTPSKCMTRVEGGTRLTLDPVTKYWIKSPL